MYLNYVVCRIWHIRTKYEHSHPQIAEKKENFEPEQTFTGSY